MIDIDYVEIETKLAVDLYLERQAKGHCITKEQIINLTGVERGAFLKQLSIRKRIRRVLKKLKEGV